MAWFGRSKKAEAVSGWGTDASIQKLWPASDLDAERDLRMREEGLGLYTEPDYWSMIRCATLLAPSLAHTYYENPILSETDAVNTAHHALYAAGRTHPREYYFSGDAQRVAQLVIGLMRRQRWVPSALGGDGSAIGDELFGPILLQTDLGDMIRDELAAGTGSSDRPDALAALLAPGGG